jgi:hypothetical protein
MAFGRLNIIKSPKRTNPNVVLEKMIVYWFRRVCFAVYTARYPSRAKTDTTVDESWLRSSQLAEQTIT